jgi:hypothetical protein
MRQNMSEIQNTEQKPLVIQWKELDEAVRKMIVMRMWEEDLQKYNTLKEELDENVQLGYN